MDILHLSLSVVWIGTRKSSVKSTRTEFSSLISELDVSALFLIFCNMQKISLIPFTPYSRISFNQTTFDGGRRWIANIIWCLLPSIAHTMAIVREKKPVSAFCKSLHFAYILLLNRRSDILPRYSINNHFFLK
ncbi:hypothetical protein [Desulfosarcina sp.]|uniref:hypothetical protein n=1 Tax=Desulfosarcina sp. TaxID=2027861 RepID=UPI003970B122